MKILAIRGSNLASLVGDFELLLDREPLGPTGLFAISGPTGSGKSTLLDAMCLALYARTPRLNTKAGTTSNSLIGRADEDPGQRLKSQDPRGLLSRGCGRGYAEVDFLGQDGRRYRARWIVRRARDRAEGRYQKDQITLCDIETQERLGENKKDTLELIRDKLGLEYDQFRRSVLLAQGDFAAFLEADPSERGELLESITGMEIYSRLSRAAHERSKEERVELERLRAESKGYVCLDDEVRKDLGTQEAALARRGGELLAELQELGVAIAWFEEERKLSTTVRQAREALFAAMRQLREDTALAVTGWEALEGEPEQVRDLLPLWRRMHRELSVAVEELARSEAELADLRRQAERARKDRTNAEKEADASEKELADLKAERAGLSKQLLEQDAWLAAHEDWRELCTQWPRWRQELDRARQLASDLSEAQREKESLEKTLLAWQAGIEEAGVAHAAARKELEEAEQKHGELAARLAELDLDALMTEQERLRRCRDGMRALRDLGKRREGARKSLDGAQAAAEEQAGLMGRTKGEKQKVERERSALESARKESQRQLESLLEKQSLDEHRKRLEAGKPCPLCGALEHPYAEELFAEMLGEAESRTTQLGRESEGLSERLQRLASDLGSQEQARQEALDRSLLAEREIEEVRGRGEEVLAKLREDWRGEPAPSLPEDGPGMQDCETLLAGLEARLEEQQGRIEERSRVEKEHRAVLELRAKAEKRSRATLEKQRGLEVDLQKTELGIQHAERSFVRLQAQLTKQLDALDEPLRAKGDWRELFLGERDLLLEELDQLSLDWEERSANKARFEKELQGKDARQQALVVQGADRRRRADACKVVHEEKGAAVERREAEQKQKLGGMSSAALRASLGTADKQAVLLQERANRLEEHGKARPKTGEEDCRQASEERSQEREVLLPKLESIRYELRKDAEARVKLAELLPGIEAQQERSETWQALSELIGSYDGRKFRDFAQSLSLDAMVAQANLHLRELAPRYRLQRVPGEDLDLQILDLHMGEELRGVHSLSGGESFLVSLALALGLSSMHASHGSLESLFIDEGFGSLDEDSLEMAIAALDALQATGRQIGLISHVGGMAERIGREVRVLPLGGGRSRLDA